MTVLFLAAYGLSGHFVLKLWKSFVHLIPLDDEVDPHSAFAYTVVFLFGPPILLLCALREFIFGKHR